MNVSGPAVARVSRKLGLDPADLVIVFDDLDLPLGKVRARMKGSAGGHHGVQSVIAALGTDAFRRVKVGIGRPAPPGQQRDRVVDHVLSPFYPDEREAIESACTLAGDLALKLVAGQLERWAIPGRVSSATRSGCSRFERRLCRRNDLGEVPEANPPPSEERAHHWT